MNERKLHIITFDVPYPVNHGGFFDLFYKISALHQLGVQIILHCFEYGKGEQPALNQYCSEVHYYKRRTGFQSISLQLPYIVASRINIKLFENLSKDNIPILLEGTHCTYLLYKDLFPGRKILYRLHNIESIYYYHLYLNERSIFKKLYYLIESRLLKKYEKIIRTRATEVLTVSENDAGLLKQFNPDAAVEYLPVFLPYQNIAIKEGIGNYFLYHGNLSVSENEKAALELIEYVSPHIELQLIIAGHNPSRKIIEKAAKQNTVQIISNPSEEALHILIQEAQAHIVRSYNQTGIKLKLLHALFFGRHCIVNEAALPDNGFRNYCHIANSFPELIQTLKRLKDQPFTSNDIKKRKAYLLNEFNNLVSAKKIIERM